MEDSNLKIYSIYDTVAEIFGPLFEAVNDQVATRNYQKVMENVLPQFRSDYALFQLGEYQPKLGEIQQIVPTQIFQYSKMDAKDIKKIISKGDDHE